MAPPISQELLATAYQIFDFLQASGRQYPRSSPVEAESTVRSIVATSFRPAIVRAAVTRQTQNSSTAPPAHPPEWATDRPRFRRDVSQFVVATREYRRSQHYLDFVATNQQATTAPPVRDGIVTPDRAYSTGATPEPSPPGAPRSNRSTSPTDSVGGGRNLWPSIEGTLSGALPSDTAYPSASSQPTTANPSSQATTQPPSATPPSSTDMDNWQDTSFSQQQWNALQRLMRQSAAAAAGPPGPPGPPGPAGPAAANNAGNGYTGTWNPQEVGYFDPFYDNKTVVTGGPIEHAGKDTYFRDVHIFIDRIKDMAIVKGEKLVRDNLYTCFKGKALHWYSSILSPEQKRLVKLGEGVDEWVAALLKRYKESASSAMTTLTTAKYTMEDARRKREPLEYAILISRAAKATDMSVLSQVTLIYNGIELELRRDLSKPTEATTMESCLQELEDNKELWWDLAAARQRPTGGFQANRTVNFRPAGQLGSYTLNSGRGGYGNPVASAGYSQLPRPTQYPTSYQFQNRAYQPQQQQRPYGYSGRQYQPAGQQAGRGQPLGNQPYRPRQQQPATTGANPPPANRGTSGLQPAGQPLRQNNNPPGGYPPGGYQSGGYRPPFQPNRNFQPQPRAFYSDESKENEENSPPAEEGAFQGGYYDEYDYQPIFEEEGQQGNEDLSEQQQSADDHGYFVGTPAKQVRIYTCRRCTAEFYSNNKLHKHVRSCKLTPPSNLEASTPEAVKPADIFQASIIQSNAPHDSHPGVGFRSWRYATFAASIGKPDSLNDLVADTGCGTSLVDRTFLAAEVPDYKQRVKTANAIRVRGIGDALLDSTEHLPLNFRIPGKAANGSAAIACFTRHVYIVDGLKAKLLVANDIIGPEQMIPDIGKEKLTIGSCQDMTATLTVKNAGPPVKRVARSSEATKIPARSRTAIAFKLRGKGLPTGRDFMFVPSRIDRLGAEGGVLSHIVDANTAVVLVHNASSEDVFLPRNSKLGVIQEYEEEGCFLASDEEAPLAANSGSHKPAPRNWFKSAMKAGVAAMAAGVAAYQAIAKPNMPAKEIVTQAGITVYGESPVIQNQLATVAESYPQLWQDDGSTVRIPPDEWMPIDILPDAKVEAAKVYPLGPADREFVDEAFDKLHEQGRMEYTTQPTPHGYPVFVVWRTVSGPNGLERKGRVVVDIRGLNKIAVTDSYPMPLQSDITASVAGCQYISVFDAAGFFHQWLVRLADRHKLTVVSHRGQEQFNVAVMGFKNSPPYVQRKIDGILRAYRAFARAYVDDIVVFSRTLEEHIDHLHSVFKLLNSYGISLSPKKSFLGYPTVALLGQKVDAFGLTTAADKLEAIAKLDFPYTLKELETYLGLTGWLRGFIPWYAQKADALQTRKTLLLRQSPSTKGSIRKTFSRKTIVENPTDEELESYRQLQESFSQATFLVHFSPDRTLYIDIDASKRRGFGAIIYHLKSTCLNPEKPKRTDIEPILFLSRMLNDAETRYWPTELEMAGLVWVVRRVRHMIEAAKNTTVVFTDHAANTSIAKQTTLSSSNTDKLNLRLIRASTYLSQFRLDVKHRPGKEHVVPDALSRLSSGNGPANTLRTSPSDVLDLDSYFSGVEDPSCDPDNYAYAGTLISMSDDFRKQITDGYANEKVWRHLLTVLKKLATSAQEEQDTSATADVHMKDVSIPKKFRTGIDFQLENDGLIYYTGEGAHRLCIPTAAEEEVFRLAHDANAHAGVHRCFSRIADTLYIPRLSRKIRQYIEHCPSCQLTQTKRHRPYGELMPVTSPPQPFHTIAMDFILALPGELDILLTVTCKYSRRVTLIPGKSTYSASQWGNALLDRLLIADWGIPAAIVSDRDPKFMSEMWQTFFQRMGTKLLTSTAYHPQTDGTSERTNQTVEIAIRFLITNYPDINFVLALPSLQAQLNNSANVATGLSPNEINYGFKVREALTSLTERQATDLPAQRLEYRQEAADATAFANAKAKIYYDARHVPLRFKAGDYAYLRLHHGYQLPGRPNKKVSQQRCGPFLVKRRVGRLAYELELPPAWRVHPVISVAQLEPVPAGEDPYRRPRPSHPDAVEMEGDTPQYQSYEVEKLVGKRLRRYKRTTVTQYLVRWVGYGPEYDEWRSLSALDNCLELVEEYEANQPVMPANSRRGRKRRLAISSEEAIPRRRGRPRHD